MRILHKYLFLGCALFFALNNCYAQKTTDKPVVYDDKVLFGGCWFVPHNSEINIRFSENSNFLLHDLDATGKEKVMTGKYLLDGHNLWLIYNERPKQKFNFYKTEGTDAHFIFVAYGIEASKYRFVHGSCD